MVVKTTLVTLAIFILILSTIVVISYIVDKHRKK